MAILFQGGIMKKISLLMIALIITACGGKPSEPEAAAAVTAEEIEVVVEAAQETSSPPAMVEFVWHSKAEGFSDDALWSHTEYWANVATEAGWDLRLSAIHTPRVENENFDFLWVMVWPTVEARDNAWADWGENHEAAWLELTSETFTYSADNAYGFAPTSGRPATTMNTTGTGIVEYIFCSYREGQGEAQRMAFESMHGDFVDAYEAEMGASSYWWAIMNPLFEPAAENNFDYMWANFFASDSERDAIYSAYGASEHSSQEQVDASCADPASFDTRIIFTAGA
jgi:hypothetical protein